MGTLVFWAAELLVTRRTPQFPRLLFFLAAVLMCVGGWMVFNAKAIYDSDFFVFVPLRNLAPPLIGSTDYAISAAWLVRGGLLLGTILFVADLSQSDRWLLRVWYVIGLVAGSIAFLGLLQKATGAQMIFWQPPPPPEVWVSTFFASYYYHGNAGAFLNLVWPLNAGLVIRAFSNRSHPGMRATWICLFILTMAGVLANTSRMAQLVGLLLLVAICVQFVPALVRNLSGSQKSVAFAGTLAILLALIALAQATHLDQPLNRWQAESQRISGDARWRAFHVAMGALPDAGLFGFGPGTFRVVFPTYNVGSANEAPGTWRFLHEDYLQTLLEWGWLGSSLWALLFFGGITVGIRNYKKFAKRGWIPRRRVLQPLVITALLGVAVHALVDFPLQIESIQLYVATYLGLCWGSPLWHQEQSAAKARNSVVRSARALRRN
ncbi:MAG TPA: O-antigen ligase family protein [Candidatus Limnocylindria bacterium]|nr:O-antigen ligase family protein [Candidatus Limnocylindria bacterium]